MALTKVTKSGLADNSVDAAKLVDGTVVAADINDGTITNAKLAGSIANAKLANSSITVNGTAVALGSSTSVLAFAWQSVVTSNTTMVSGRGYFVNTTGGAITMTLPASPSAGDYVAIKDYAATFQTNNLTIARNGSNIQGNANNSALSTTRASVVLVYVDATKGWLYTNESNVSDLAPKYVEATGGTTSTTGDFKVHTFNSSSNFVVSQLGNPFGGPSNVDYLVVGGGGAGGRLLGGGGGAGGYRTSFPSPNSNAGAHPVSVTTYPITVGGGGSSPGSSGTGTNGAQSIFSTITSSGGAKGGSTNGTDGNAGASGGGGSYGGSGGAGNTPPVSPSQGNAGGNGSQPAGVGGGLGGGGGGASQAGTN